MNSNAKGKRGELAAVKFLEGLGFTARRTQQYCGTEGTSDVAIEELPYVHVEVKVGGTLGEWRPGAPRLNKACEQAARDCPEGKAWVVLHKPDRGPWLLTTHDRTVTAEHARHTLSFLNWEYEVVNDGLL